MSKKTQAIVIGSGFGGLACAIRLQSAGVQVTLLEKRDKPGGRAYVYKDNGFTFDAGPTVITAPPCLEELFELSTRNIKDYVELVPVTPSISCSGKMDMFLITPTTMKKLLSKSKSSIQKMLKITPSF